jgi:hypothetical protein
MNQQLEKLRATLAELESELAGLESLDPQSRAHLASVASEISSALQRTNPISEELATKSPSLPDQLTENVTAFRTQHPTLAGILQRLIDGLAQLGI